MTTATLDRRVGAYRCPDCAVGYVRSKDGLRAVSIDPMRSLVPDTEGAFACPCGSTQGFAWEPERKRGGKR